MLSVRLVIIVLSTGVSHLLVSEVLYLWAFVYDIQKQAFVYCFTFCLEGLLLCVYAGVGLLLYVLVGFCCSSSHE